jgi:hypothetical protein
MLDNYFEIKSIDPIYWGKNGWIFLNSIALTYNPLYKEHYKNFILQLPYILPCKSCGENLKKNMCSLDYALNSKENFVNWLINIRNEIYDEIGIPENKKTIKNTFDEIFYLPSNNIYLFLSLSIFILIILIILFKNIQNIQS